MVQNIAFDGVRLYLTPSLGANPELWTAKLGLKNKKHHSIVNVRYTTYFIYFDTLNGLGVDNECDRKTDRIAIATACV